jgi:peptidoglycan/LPS O-acetylase OafA/YrhL
VTRLRPLDGLRGLAITLVIAFHEVQEFAPGGAIGVDVFFALSSFLITSLLLDETNRRGSIDFIAFYWRRVCRLGPALIVFLLVVAPLSSIVLHRSDEILSSTLVTLAYISDFAAAGVGDLWIGLAYGHTWSLSVEEQFYLVWPVVLLLLARAGWVRWGFAVIAMIVSVAAFAASTISLGEGATYYLPTGHLTSLTAGVIAVIWLMYRPHQLNWARSSLAAAVAVTLIVAWTTIPQAHLLPPAVRVAIATLLSLGMCAILVHVVSSSSSWVSGLLSTRPIVWLGERSYGIYLYGTAIHLATAAIPVRRLWGITLSVALGLLFSAISYRWVERPLRSRGRAWINRRRPQAAHV